MAPFSRVRASSKPGAIHTLPRDLGPHLLLTESLKPRQARGAASHESFESEVASVMLARLSGKGKDRRPVLDEMHADLHWNLRANPSSVEAQVQGSVILALGTVMPSHHITLRNGVVEQCHFNDMSPPLRRDLPKMMAGRIDLGADAHKCMAKPVLPP